jgi:hypothetical protein
VSPLEAAGRLASGADIFHKNFAADEFVASALKGSPRQAVSPEEELSLWETFEALCAELSPKVKFGRDGVCNGAEKRRRNAMFGMIRLVSFRSDDPRVKAVFQRCFGQVSLQWMLTVCGTDAPPHYYEWAFEAIPSVDGKTWGEKALSHVSGSRPHMEAFRRLAPEKSDLLAVKQVMRA